VQPIDLSHLARQTGGDAALEAEVLRLFANRVPADLERLQRAAPDERRDIAHLILGSARAIGATEVARCAAAVEAGTGEVAPLARAIAAATRFIAGHLAK
jgi:HPt (histidine-containing phosphotransfer) domain-containing protein